MKENFDFDFFNCFLKGFVEVIWERIGFFEKMRDVNIIIKRLFGGEENIRDFIYGLDFIVVVDKDGNVCFMIYIINSEMWGIGFFV